MVLERLSRYDAAIEAYRKGLAVARDPFQRAQPALSLAAKPKRVPTAIRRHSLSATWPSRNSGPPSEPPEPQWLSAWIAVQRQRMAILYWLNDTRDIRQLIERVRPFVEAHGSAEQRASFFLSIVQ